MFVIIHANNIFFNLYFENQNEAVIFLLNELQFKKIKELRPGVFVNEITGAKYQVRQLKKAPQINEELLQTNI